MGIAGALALIGCVTDDFKVVDALSEGMTKEQAAKTIASYGFRLESSLNRPEEGWVDEGESFTNLPGRARRVEEELNTVIAVAEYYPVHHGLLGFGQLFLFYDGSERLVKYYRRQIN